MHGQAAPFTIRDFAPADRGWALAANNRAAPHVGELTAATLESRLAAARFTRIAEAAGRPIGLIMVFGPGAAYDSPNYRWISDQYDDFLYVDRVFVIDARRGGGIGAGMYEDIERLGGGAAPWLTCEVNELPPNPGSLRFHRRLGFAVVGNQDYDGGARRVVFLAKPLA